MQRVPAESDTIFLHAEPIATHD
eukprot:COSAG02_NODE_36628_length_452_cov_1.016997_2_plen_22_part_01